jgi:hypothetical protein
LICGEGKPIHSSTGVYRSGQTGQTVNLMAYAFVGSNPTAPMKKPREDAAGFFDARQLGVVPCPRAGGALMPVIRTTHLAART